MPRVDRSGAEPPLVLTIDIGTSSARVLLFDRLGRMVEGVEGRASYSTRTTPDGGVEFDAEELLDYVFRALDGALHGAGALAEKIAAVAACTFWHSLLGTDSSGLPVTPVLTWADTRSDVRDELRKEMDEKAVHARTGCLFHSSYLPAKLRWLSKERTETCRRAAWWGSFGEFLYRRLFGRTIATVSMASGSGLLDVHACSWDKEVLNAVGVRADQLSPLGDVDTPLTALDAAFAKRWPALKDVPWTPPLGDGACNNLGSGCTHDRRIAVMVGTSGAMRAVRASDRVDFPWGIFGYRADRRRYVLGGALSNGGNLMEWVRCTFLLGSTEDLERELRAMEPDAHGLTFLPFLAGERSPNWSASARAAITGLSLHSRPVDVLRAAMESVAYRFALILRLLGTAIPQAEEIIASGGGLLRSRVWMQIMADVLGRPVTAFEAGEASSRGAALLTLERLGALKRLEDAPVETGETYAPDAKRHARYQEAVDRQQALYDQLIGP